MPNPILKRFTVEGSGDFPFDMLRSDQCWPASKVDAGTISERHGTDDTKAAGMRKITLETAAKYTPDRRRWLSCNWRVLD